MFRKIYARKAKSWCDGNKKINSVVGFSVLFVLTPPTSKIQPFAVQHFCTVLLYFLVIFRTKLETPLFK